MALAQLLFALPTPIGPLGHDRLLVGATVDILHGFGSLGMLSLREPGCRSSASLTCPAQVFYCSSDPGRVVRRPYCTLGLVGCDHPDTAPEKPHYGHPVEE